MAEVDSARLAATPAMRPTRKDRLRSHRRVTRLSAIKFRRCGAVLDIALPASVGRAAPGAIGSCPCIPMPWQILLPGAPGARSQNQIRPSYRRLFDYGGRWPFSGIRLADDR